MAKIFKSKIDYRNSSKKDFRRANISNYYESSGLANESNVSQTTNKVKGTDLPVETDLIGGLAFKFGQFLLGKNKRQILIITSLPSLLSIYVFVDWGFFSVIQKLGNLAIWIRAASIFWSILIIVVLSLLTNSTCEKCGKRVAMRKIRKVKIGSTEYKGDKIYNIEETHKCDYCGFIKKIKVTESASSD